MEQPEQPVEYEAEHRPGRRGDRLVSARQRGLGQLEVPVAELVPGEVIEDVAGLGELEAVKQRVRVAVTAASRDRIQRSGTASVAGSGKAAPELAPAPLSSANLVAFHSLLQKFRAPATHSSLMATSPPGLDPRARVNRVASAPNRSIQSSGSTVLPRDLDIFLP